MVRQPPSVARGIILVTRKAAFWSGWYGCLRVKIPLGGRAPTGSPEQWTEEPPAHSMACCSDHRNHPRAQGGILKRDTSVRASKCLTDFPRGAPVPQNHRLKGPQHAHNPWFVGATWPWKLYEFCPGRKCQAAISFHSGRPSLALTPDTCRHLFSPFECMLFPGKTEHVPEFASVVRWLSMQSVCLCCRCRYSGLACGLPQLYMSGLVARTIPMAGQPRPR